MKCAYCKEPAYYFCDYILGSPAENVEVRPGKLNFIKKIKPFITCDLPLCREHRDYRGKVHFNPGGFESIDWCFCHEDEQDIRRAVTPELAEHLRNAIKFNHKTKPLRLVKSGMYQPDMFRDADKDRPS